MERVCTASLMKFLCCLPGSCCMSSSRDCRKDAVGSGVLSLTSSSRARAWRVVQNSDVWLRPKYLWGRNMRCLGCQWVCLNVLRYMFANV